MAETQNNAFSEAWKNPDIRAARSTQLAVIVDGVLFRSLRKAFTALDITLSESRIIAIRKVLAEYRHITCDVEDDNTGTIKKLTIDAIALSRYNRLKAQGRLKFPTAKCKKRFHIATKGACYLAKKL